MRGSRAAAGSPRGGCPAGVGWGRVGSSRGLAGSRVLRGRGECVHTPSLAEGCVVCVVVSLPLIALAPSRQPSLLASPPPFGVFVASLSLSLSHQPGMESIVSGCPEVFFSVPLEDFVPWAGWSQHGTRFLSTQLLLLPKVGQQGASSLSQLPDWGTAKQM